MHPPPTPPCHLLLAVDGPEPSSRAQRRPSARPAHSPHHRVPSSSLCLFPTDTERPRSSSSPEDAAAVSQSSSHDVQCARRPRLRRIAEGHASIWTRRDASFTEDSPDPRARRRRFAAVEASPPPSTSPSCSPKSGEPFPSSHSSPFAPYRNPPWEQRKVAAFVDATLAPVHQQLPLLAYAAPRARSKPTHPAMAKLALQSTITTLPAFCPRQTRRRRHSGHPLEP